MCSVYVQNRASTSARSSWCASSEMLSSERRLCCQPTQRHAPADAPASRRATGCKPGGATAIPATAAALTATSSRAGQLRNHGNDGNAKAMSSSGWIRFKQCRCNGVLRNLRVKMLRCANYDRQVTQCLQPEVLALEIPVFHGGKSCLQEIRTERFLLYGSNVRRRQCAELLIDYAA